jgi:hypothetical protein
MERGAWGLSLRKVMQAFVLAAFPGDLQVMVARSFVSLLMG